MSEQRREFLKRSAVGMALTLAYSVGGSVISMTPGEAHAKGVSLRVLNKAEAGLLGRLAEAMVPGAIKAGVVHFIDHQLGVDPDDALLIAKYFQVMPPYTDFYRNGLKAVESFAQSTHKSGLQALDDAALDTLVGEFSRPGTKAEGVDLFLFYLCLRSDAVDVVYGTPRGFEALNVPMMAHILPPEGWNG